MIFRNDVRQDFADFLGDEADLAPVVEAFIRELRAIPVVAHRAQAQRLSERAAEGLDVHLIARIGGGIHRADALDAAIHFQLHSRVGGSDAHIAIGQYDEPSAGDVRSVDVENPPGTNLHRSISLYVKPPPRNVRSVDVECAPGTNSDVPICRHVQPPAGYAGSIDLETPVGTLVKTDHVCACRSADIEGRAGCGRSNADVAGKVDGHLGVNQISTGKELEKIISKSASHDRLLRDRCSKPDAHNGGRSDGTNEIRVRQPETDRGIDRVAGGNGGCADSDIERCGGIECSDAHAARRNEEVPAGVDLRIGFNLNFRRVAQTGAFLGRDPRAGEPVAGRRHGEAKVGRGRW